MHTYVYAYMKKINNDNPVRDTFSELYNIAPPMLNVYVDRLANVPQNEKWHPEGNTLIHTQIVVNRLGSAYPNNKILQLAGLFHDLGKFDAYEYNDGAHNAYGHEKFSTYYVQYFWSWLSTFSINPNDVKEIVGNHMIIKSFSEFRSHRQNEIKKLNMYEDLVRFAVADSKILPIDNP